MSNKKNIPKEELKKLSDKLTLKDIEFRIDDTYYSEQSETAFAALIAYKNARVDMKRLDDVIGPGGWQNKYKRDSKGILQCAIGIKVVDEWVWKTSNGVPSQFASEKGEYSDALKRAGFMWGIGRELYEIPRLRVVLRKSEYRLDKDAGGNLRPKTNYSFEPNDWHWKLDWEHEGEHGKKGLIWAKDSPTENGYRVKPSSIYLGPNHWK